MRGKTIAAAFWLALAATSGLRAQDVAAFYADKTISFLVAAGAGGGYDLYARSLARHMSKHIPGNPAFAIQNLPGGGGIVAANTLYNTSKRDGTAIAILASSVFLASTLGDPATKFDNLKFSPVGNMNEEVDTCPVWHATGLKSIDDMRARDVVIGTTGAGSNSHTFPLGMNAIIGTRFKPILGYPGVGRMTSMERGEIDGACGIFVSTLLTQFAKQVASGELRVLVQMGLSRHPAFANVPNALELAPDEKARGVLELLFAQLALGRPVLAPPDLPPDRVRALATAFDRTMADPAFIEEATRTGLERRWFGADRVREVMAKMETAPADARTRVRGLLGIAAKPGP